METQEQMYELWSVDSDGTSSFVGNSKHDDIQWEEMVKSNDGEWVGDQGNGAFMFVKLLK